MKYNFDPMYTIECFKDIVNVPSPVGYYPQMNPVMERYAKELGHEITFDNKSTAYITLEGEDKELFDRLLNLLDEVDDVQDVYHNVEL